MLRRFLPICAASILALVPAAQAQPTGGAMMSPMSHRAETVLCPTNVKVQITPSPAASGWTYSTATSPMHLDPSNPPRIDPTILVCSYVFASGNNAFDYSQPLSGRTCTVRPDKTGFECH